MMQEVVERTSAPYSAVCYVTTVFPDGVSLRGSGAVIGPNDVLTALHMVYQASHGGWATQVSVTPGADTVPYDAPYGSFTDFGTLDGRAVNWDLDGDGLITDAEAQGDLAVIGLRSRIGDATGWLQPLQIASDIDAVALGYPARPPLGAGLGMMSQPAFGDASATYGVYDVQGSLGPGGSGGPLVYTTSGVSYVTGVLSSGTGDNSASTYAALFGAGTWAWLQQVTSANDGLVPAQQQSAIAGTPGADLLLGDALDNSITAGAGDDTLRGAGGNDMLDGGEGLDIAIFAGLRSAYTGAVSDDSISVHDNQVGRDGADKLVSVERLAFADVNLAFDLAGNAGIVARILGAVFGPAMVGNAQYAGVGLARLDHGMDALDLVQFALHTRLGPDAGDAAVVDLLYANVTGAAPSSEVAADYVAMLQSHEVSQAWLAGYAALTEMNAVNIGLVGLAGRGLAYVPEAV
jgi:V8-like Glu-specific endopeptidase